MHELYLGFEIQGRQFCAELSAIREVRQFTQLTTLPLTQSHVLGVVNLAGEVVPVVDLPLVLGLKQREAGNPPGVCLVGQHGERLTALVVDSVLDVLEIPNNKIGALPAGAVFDGNSYLLGVCQIGEDSDAQWLVVNLQLLLSQLNPEAAEAIT